MFDRDAVAVWVLTLALALFIHGVNLAVTALIVWATGWNFIAVLVSVIYTGEKMNEIKRAGDKHEAD